MKKWFVSLVVAMGLILSSCSSDSQEAVKVNNVENKMNRTYTISELFDQYVTVTKGNYYPSEYKYGTKMSEITQELGEALPYEQMETESQSGTETESLTSDAYYYRESYKMDDGTVMDVKILYYGDESSDHELEQVRYLFPFQSKEECRELCEAFVEWIGKKGDGDDKIELKLEDIYQESNNTDLAISGKGHQTYMTSGIRWKTDVADPNDLEQDVFFIQLINPARTHID